MVIEIICHFVVENFERSKVMGNTVDRGADQEKSNWESIELVKISFIAVKKVNIGQKACRIDYHILVIVNCNQAAFEKIIILEKPMVMVDIQYSRVM